MATGDSAVTRVGSMATATREENNPNVNAMIEAAHRGDLVELQKMVGWPDLVLILTYSPLSYFIFDHQLVILKIDPNRYNVDMRTPIHLAAAGGHLECVEQLVQAGTDVIIV